MCKKYFWKEYLFVLKFSSVRSSHDLCAHAHVHSLEEKLLLTKRSEWEDWKLNKGATE